MTNKLSTTTALMPFIFAIILSIYSCSEYCDCVDGEDMTSWNKTIMNNIYEKADEAVRFGVEGVVYNVKDVMWNFVSGKFVFIDSHSSVGDIKSVMGTDNDCIRCIYNNIQNDNSYFLIIHEGDDIYPVKLDKEKVVYSGDYLKFFPVNSEVEFRIKNNGGKTVFMNIVNYDMSVE